MNDACSLNHNAIPQRKPETINHSGRRGVVSLKDVYRTKPASVANEANHSRLTTNPSSRGA